MKLSHVFHSGGFLFLLCIPLALAPRIAAQDVGKVVLPEKNKVHLFLLAGQSNMAGRGEVGEIDRKTHPHVLTLNKDGEWILVSDPIHFDKPGVGVGPGKTFGEVVAEADPDIVVGLIPTACGGSSIDHWLPGAYFSQTRSHPYDDAIARARLAMEQGTLKGVLWHQGESDCAEGKSSVYSGKLEALIERFRKDLDRPELPFLIGQLGQFSVSPWTPFRTEVDRAHKDVASRVENVTFISSDGLTCNPDGVHFNASSMREFGKRYAASYLKHIQ